MRVLKSATIAFILLLIVLLGCNFLSSPTDALPPTVVLELEAPLADTEAPAATEIPPTEVAAPPTEAEAPPTETTTPPTEIPVTAESIEISTDQLADDGCPLVVLNTDSWAPMSASYNAGDDPLYQFHDNEEGFYFNVELYTVYGAGWTGQSGTFAVDCNASGICVYLVVDDVNPYLATAGEIVIDSLSQEGNSLQRPVQISMTNLTMQPTPGSTSPGCFHIDDVSITIED